MKHPDAAEPMDESVFEDELSRLILLSSEIGVHITRDQGLAMIEHLDRVLECNAQLNLTRITTRADALVAHVVDSLAAVPELPGLDQADRIADIGSGAGFPGVPLALVLPCSVTLVESIGKKAAFLSEATGLLSGHHRIHVYPGRAEELALEERGVFKVVIARAVTALPSLVELASPLLSTGGSLIALKGAPETQELQSGAEAAALVGMSESGRSEYLLPVLGHRRTIVRYVKVGEPKMRLPRRVGVAQKRPLA